jgi:chemotaxis protein CheX
MEQYIKPFIEVCEIVFKDFVGAEVKAKQVFFIAKEEFQNWDISGIIGLSGEASGAVAISMKEETAFEITKLLTLVKPTSVDDNVTDVIGEIINIIAGNVKKSFEDQFRIKISLPSIIKGKAHTIVWPVDKTRIICIPFEVFQNQQICLSVAIQVLK